jgi:hypothetical protein
MRRISGVLLFVLLLTNVRVVWAAQPKETASISVSQTTDMDFGSMRQGSAPTAKQISIHNTGTGTADNLLVQISGSHFTISSIPNQLAVGGVATFTIQPRADLSPGEFTDKVTISAGAGGQSVWTFMAKIKVNTQANQGLLLDQTDVLDFGVAKTGSPTPYRLVNILNDTGKILTDLTATLSGDNTFAIGGLSSTLAQGANTSIVVSPKSGLEAGVYFGRVILASGSVNAYFEVKYEVRDNFEETFTLSKNEEYDFGVLNAGYNTAPSTLVEVTNVSASNLDGITVTVSGANPNVFTVSPMRSLKSTIAPGETNGFYITPAMRLDVGVYSARIVVTSGLETHEIAVTVRVNRTNSDIRINPSELHDFGTHTAGYAALPWHSVAVTNMSAVAIAEIRIGLSGVHKDAFTLSKNTIHDLASRANEHFTVRPVSGLPDGVYTATVGVSDGKSEVDFDVKFTVTPAAATYTVTFVDSNKAYAVKTVTADKPILEALPIPGARNGYSFAGWFTEDLSKRIYPGTVIAGDIYIFSRWVTASAGAAGLTETPGGWGAHNAPLYERFSVMPTGNTRLIGQAVGEEVRKELITANRQNEELMTEIYELQLTEAQTGQPFQVTAYVGDLTPHEKQSLTGVLWNDDLTAYRQLGGVLSGDGSALVFCTYESGKTGLLFSKNLLTLKFSINDPAYTKNGSVIINDVAPYISEENRTMVPLRVISEAIGADVSWDEPTQTASLRLDENVVYIAVGKPLPGNMGVAAIHNDRTFIPMRYAAETLQANVVWNDADKSISIYK